MKAHLMIAVAFLSLSIVSLLEGSGVASTASAPEDVIRGTIDEVFEILKDKSLAGKPKRSQRIAALHRVADRSFDWAEMARGSLGVRWRGLDTQQRARFVEVFKDVLAAQYMDDIDRFRGTETVTIDGTLKEAEEVVVRTTLVTSSRDRVPMDYRMRMMQGKWMVVDLSIEGVSLVNHFRKTFANALANMTVEQLIERLTRQLPHPQ